MPAVRISSELSRPTPFRDGLQVNRLCRRTEGREEGDRRPTMGAKLVRKINVIATRGLRASLTAKSATSAVQIVFAIGDDPCSLAQSTVAYPISDTRSAVGNYSRLSERWKD